MSQAYRKVRNTSEKAPDNEVRITQRKPLRNYVTYVLSQFRERGATEVTLRAMGNTMDKIVSIAENRQVQSKGSLPGQQHWHSDLRGCFRAP